MPDIIYQESAVRQDQHTDFEPHYDREAYCSLRYPFMPMRLFMSLRYDAIVACASISAMLYYSGTVIRPTMAGALYTTSVSEVSWLSCAVGGGLLLGQISGVIGVRFSLRA